MKVLDRFLETERLRNWRRFWFGPGRGDYRLTRAGVMNDIALIKNTSMTDQ